MINQQGKYGLPFVVGTVTFDGGHGFQFHEVPDGLMTEDQALARAFLKNDPAACLMSKWRDKECRQLVSYLFRNGVDFVEKPGDDRSPL